MICIIPEPTRAQVDAWRQDARIEALIALARKRLCDSIAEERSRSQVVEPQTTQRECHKDGLAAEQGAEWSRKFWPEPTCGIPVSSLSGTRDRVTAATLAALLEPTPFSQLAEF